MIHKVDDQNLRQGRVARVAVQPEGGAISLMVSGVVGRTRDQSDYQRGIIIDNNKIRKAT